jgi:hypothetical protein
MKEVAVLKPRAARLACCNTPFMASTKALDRLSSEYFSPSWTAFQADRGRGFSVIVDGVSD